MQADQTRSPRRVSFLQVVAFVWSYWRRLPVRFCLIVAGALTAVTLEVQIPRLAADLVSAMRAVMEQAAPAAIAWSAMWALVGVFVAISVVQQGYLRIWMYFASEVMHHMVSDGFRRIQRFSSDWHANNFAGSTVRKVTRGMWAYDSFADTVVVELGPALVLLTGLSVAMFLREPIMGLYFAAAIVVFLAISIGMSLYYVAPANQRSNDADTEVGGALADAVTCNTVVKSFGAEDREDQRVHTIAFDWRRKARAAWMRSMDAGALQSMLIVALLAGLLGIVMTLALRGQASLADLVYVVTSYFIVNGYLRNIGWQVRNLQRAVNELDDLVEIAATEPQVADVPGARPIIPGPGAIAFRHVGFRYANQPRRIYDDFNLDIAAGEKVALVGESGSGKSTFVKLAQRLYDLDEGVIEVDGQDIARLTQDSLRRAISLVPQEPILFHRSLADNIAYGRPGASMDEIVDAARRAHAHEFISRLDTGYDTMVGERGIKLSGGERQRVAIARAILADAPILILDEATSSLDSITEHLIQDAIASLIRDRTAILIAHRLSTVRSVDRILVFDAGRIVEQGTHDELMARPGGAYRRMFDMQTLGFIDATLADSA